MSGGSAIEAGKAVVRVGLRSQIKETAKEINADLKSIAANIRGLSLITVGKGMFAGLKDALGILKEPIKVAGNLEKAVTEFEALSGSALSAKRIVEELRQFAASTSLEFGNLARETGLLLGYGVAVQDVTDDIKRISAVARGDNEKLGRIALAFGQIRSIGRLMGTELRQLTEAGFNPLQEIERTSGTSIGKLLAMGVSFDQVRNAMITATSEGGRFFKFLDKQAETLVGKFENMKDTFRLAIEPIGTAILPELKAGISAITETLRIFQNFANQNKALFKGLVLVSTGALLAVSGLVALGSVAAAVSGGYLLVSFAFERLGQSVKSADVAITKSKIGVTIEQVTTEATAMSAGVGIAAQQVKASLADLNSTFVSVGKTSSGFYGSVANSSSASAKKTIAGVLAIRKAATALGRTSKLVATEQANLLKIVRSGAKANLQYASSVLKISQNLRTNYTAIKRVSSSYTGIVATLKLVARNTNAVSASLVKSTKASKDAAAAHKVASKALTSLAASSKLAATNLKVFEKQASKSFATVAASAAAMEKAVNLSITKTTKQLSKAATQIKAVSVATSKIQKASASTTQKTKAPTTDVIKTTSKSLKAVSKVNKDIAVVASAAVVSSVAETVTRVAEAAVKGRKKAAKVDKTVDPLAKMFSSKPQVLDLDKIVELHEENLGRDFWSKIEQIAEENKGNKNPLASSVNELVEGTLQEFNKLRDAGNQMDLDAVMKSIFASAATDIPEQSITVSDSLNKLVKDAEIARLETQKALNLPLQVPVLSDDPVDIPLVPVVGDTASQKAARELINKIEAETGNLELAPPDEYALAIAGEPAQIKKDAVAARKLIENATKEVQDKLDRDGQLQLELGLAPATSTFFKDVEKTEVSDALLSKAAKEVQDQLDKAGELQLELGLAPVTSDSVDTVNKLVKAEKRLEKAEKSVSKAAIANPLYSGEVKPPKPPSGGSYAEVLLEGAEASLDAINNKKKLVEQALDLDKPIGFADELLVGAANALDAVDDFADIDLSGDKLAKQMSEAGLAIATVGVTADKTAPRISRPFTSVFSQISLAAKKAMESVKGNLSTGIDLSKSESKYKDFAESILAGTLVASQAVDGMDKKSAKPLTGIRKKAVDTFTAIGSVASLYAARATVALAPVGKVVASTLAPVGKIATSTSSLIATSFASVVPALATSLGAVGAKGAAAFTALSSVLGGGVLGTLGAIILPVTAIGVGLTYLLNRAGLLVPLFTNIKAVFVEFGKIASTAFGGIGDALASGEYMLAAEILWSGIKLAFYTGVKNAIAVIPAVFNNGLSVTYKLLKAFANTVVDVVTAIPKLIYAAFSGGASLAQIITDIIVGNFNGGELDKLILQETVNLNDGVSRASKARKKTESELAGQQKALEEKEKKERDSKDEAEKLRKSEENAIKEFDRKIANLGLGISEVAANLPDDVLKKANADAQERIKALQDEAAEMRFGKTAVDQYKLAISGVTATRRSEIALLERYKTSIEAAKNAQSKLKDIQTDIVAIVQGEAAARRLKLAQEGLNEAQINGIQAAEAQKTFAEEAYAARREIFGLTNTLNGDKQGENLRRLELARQGLNRQQIEEIIMLERRKASLQKLVDAQKELEDKAKDLRESLKSPFQRFREEVAGIKQMLAKGLITRDEATQAIERARGELGGGLQSKFATGLTSQADIFSSLRQVAGASTGADIQKQQLAQQKKHTKSLTTIANKPPVAVQPWKIN